MDWQNNFILPADKKTAGIIKVSVLQRLAIIKLIEKNGKDKRLIKNWRHISVLNVDYDTAQKMKFPLRISSVNGLPKRWVNECWCLL